ncbi:MAG TPA: hypothetical protein VKT49_07630 [Bryobacteraceae bacterium]|nr:hypothetical protein [Bryobacteraceae bacterium]
MDLRATIGYFFSLIGILVLGTGLATDYRAPLVRANVNLYTGLVLLAFGAVMLLLARMGRQSR